MSQKKPSHYFGWGDTYGVREAMMQTAPWLALSTMPIGDFGYPKHGGEPELIDLIRALCKQLTGHSYKHILITQGCTNALNAYCHAEKDVRIEYFTCRQLHFPFYPGVATNAGLIFKPGELGRLLNSVQILDSPSNPLGAVDVLTVAGRVLWDAAYYSPTYGVNISKPQTPIPDHVAMAGSFSKFSGINGIRLGWLATDEDALYRSALRWSTHDTSGISWPSQWLAIEILKKVDLEAFWQRSAGVINDNRVEIQKLSKIFGNQEIPEKGMFALFDTDDGLRGLLDTSGVITMPGSSCGDSHDSVRINLAHTRDATKAMVKAVLKADRKK
jgi:histidinol-phosphate/aromatic aminotransferase/cobyric acid decarboxylase-like protein